jgi:tetratricopeptide (TPR) repeat protein
MVFQAEDRTRAKKQHADAAIQMALQGRWAEALQLNQMIVETFPTDVDAFNRLGKALTELGRYGEARDAYMRALEIDSFNSIARKNLSRLETLGDGAPPRVASQKLSPQMFIEEMGKTGVTTLLRPNMDVAARMTAGDQVALKANTTTLTVETMGGDHVGEVEPKLGQRLLKLIQGGNEYVAAIQTTDASQVKVFIRETFQHADQTGKLSFPPTVTENFRPYTKGRLLRRDADDDNYWDEGSDSEEWDAEPESEERTPAADDEDGEGEGALDVSDEDEE